MAALDFSAFASFAAIAPCRRIGCDRNPIGPTGLCQACFMEHLAFPPVDEAKALKLFLITPIGWDG